MATYLRTVILLFLVIHSSVGYVNSDDGSGIGETGLGNIEYSNLIKRVSEELNIDHLGITQDKIKTSYQGILWGMYSQALVALPVRLARKGCKTQIKYDL